MTMEHPDLSDGLAAAAVAVLNAPEPEDKVALSIATAAAWRPGGLDLGPTDSRPAPPRHRRELEKTPAYLAFISGLS